MSLHRQNKERLIIEISIFEEGKQKIRICSNDPVKYELITGDEIRMIIFN